MHDYRGPLGAVPHRTRSVVMELVGEEYLQKEQWKCLVMCVTSVNVEEGTLTGYALPNWFQVNISVFAPAVNLNVCASSLPIPRFDLMI